jgi:hypothetical protein
MNREPITVPQIRIFLYGFLAGVVATAAAMVIASMLPR